MLFRNDLFRFFRGTSSPAKREHRVRPTLEAMEERWNPANVTATVNNGILTLTATTGNFDDVIEINDGSIAGHYDIIGTGTTINGVATFTTTKPWKTVVFNLKGGNDVVVLDADISGDVTFNGGDGENELSIESGSMIGGSVRYLNGTTKANVDKLTIFSGSTTIARDVIANFGAGTSYTTLACNYIGGRVSITGGSGADSIESLGVQIGQSLTANLGNGNNKVSLDALGDNISGGTDNTYIFGGLTINTGTGVDTIDIGSEHSVYVFGNVVMNTGNEVNGGDTVHIDNSVFQSNFTLNLGGGNDIALFETADNLNSTAAIYGLLKVTGGLGNDTIGFGQTTGARKVYFGKSPKLDGGAGTMDKLFLIDLAILGTNVTDLSLFNPQPVNFEAIVF